MSKVVLTSAAATRLYEHSGGEHERFDLSRVLYSPALGLFLASNGNSMLAIEPLKDVTSPGWQAATQPPAAKDVWIPREDLKRVAESGASQVEFVDCGDKIAFWITGGRLINVGQPPVTKDLPPLTMKFFARESAIAAALFGIKELLSIARTMEVIGASEQRTDSPPVSMAVHDVGWTKHAIEFAVAGPQQTVCRAIIMPLDPVACGDYSQFYSAKPPGLNDAALKLLDWRTCPPPKVEVNSPGIDVAIAVLKLIQSGSTDVVNIAGLGADQLASARNLMAHVVAALNVLRSGG